MFIDAIAGSLASASLTAIAQTPATVRRVGILTTDAPETQATIDSNFAPLRALGWVEGRNLRVERRYTSGNVDLLRLFAEELVRLGVELIGTLGTPAAMAAKSATKTIPIVIWSAADPVGSGLVASLARPGGNVTGFSFLSPEVDTKRVELLRDLVPGLRRVGSLETQSNPYYHARRSRLEEACRSLGVEPIFIDVALPGEVESAIRELARRGAQALMVPQEPVFYENPSSLMTVASKFALPTLAATANFVEAGAVASLSHSGAEQDERFAWFVDKILRGARPAELPIQQPTRFVLVVSLKSARSLGLSVPRSILLRADHVIE